MKNVFLVLNIAGLLKSVLSELTEIGVSIFNKVKLFILKVLFVIFKLLNAKKYTRLPKGSKITP